MSYVRANVQPAHLNEGESAVELDDGTLVAVSIKTPERLENGSMSIQASARWIDAQGESQLVNGSIVETHVNTTMDAYHVTTYGLPALAKEVLLASLGEPPELMKDVLIVEGAEQFVPTQNTDSIVFTDKETTQKPVLDLPDSDRSSVSIRHAISSVKAISELASPKDLLGL